MTDPPLSTGLPFRANTGSLSIPGLWKTLWKGLHRTLVDYRMERNTEQNSTTLIRFQAFIPFLVLNDHRTLLACFSSSLEQYRQQSTGTREVTFLCFLEHVFPSLRLRNLFPILDDQVVDETAVGREMVAIIDERFLHCVGERMVSVYRETKE